MTRQHKHGSWWAIQKFHMNGYVFVTRSLSGEVAVALPVIHTITAIIVKFPAQKNPPIAGFLSETVYRSMVSALAFAANPEPKTGLTTLV